MRLVQLQAARQGLGRDGGRPCQPADVRRRPCRLGGCNAHFAAATAFGPLSGGGQRPRRGRICLQRPVPNQRRAARAHLPLGLQARHQVWPGRPAAGHTAHRGARPVAQQPRPAVGGELSRGSGRESGRPRKRGGQHAEPKGRRHGRPHNHGGQTARAGICRGRLCVRAGAVCRARLDTRRVFLQQRVALPHRLFRRRHRKHSHL